MAYSFDKKNNAIVVSGFEEGIADDPYSGISDMRNMDIISVPKEASVAMSTSVMTTQGAISSTPFWIDAASGNFKYNGTVPLEINTAVTLSDSGNALPPGFSANTAYYVKSTPTSTTFTLSAYVGGPVIPAATLRALVIGGGGAGGLSATEGTGGGGGGAGGYQYDATHAVTAQAYSIVIGTGGATAGANGTNSTFDTITGIGGGGGGAGGTPGANGANGGSGGGGSGNRPPAVVTHAGGTGSQGHNGGYGHAGVLGVSDGNAGGGGGAGTVGANAAGTDTVGGAGGNGTSNSISGSPVTYAGGGGGGGEGSESAGGTGGGGAGGYYTGTNGVAGTDGLGGGGGGAGGITAVFGAGGKGVVIISYITAHYGACTGGTITTSSNRTIHTFTSSGTFTLVSATTSASLTFSTIQMGTPLGFTNYLWDNHYYYYFLYDSNGRVWVYNGTALGLGSTSKWVYMHNVADESSTPTITGMIAYKGYLFVFELGTIDVISIIDFTALEPTLAWLTTAGNWIDNWNTLIAGITFTTSHQAIVSINDSSVYVCNGNNIATIFQVPGSLVPSISVIEPFNITATKSATDGVTTDTSTTITTVSSFFEKSDEGAIIVGVGIPDGTIITQVVSSQEAVISEQASASDTGVTFTITTAYDFSPNILPLPPNEQATCLAELGDNLMIGGINNYIYPWDRTSPNFAQPIFLAENYVYRMVTVNTNTFAFVGERGRIWVTNGSQAELWKKIPDHISGTVNPFYIWKDAIFNRDQLYFGFSVTNNTGSIINQYGGMWAVDVETKALRLLNKLSYDTYAGYASALFAYRGDSVGAAQTSNGYGTFTGWYSGSVGGVDRGTATPYTGSQAIVVSELIPIGTFDNPTDFERIEYKLSKPLVAGESVNIYARLIFDTSDTGFGASIVSDSTAGNFSKSGPVNFKNAQWLQLKAVTNSTASSPSYTRLTQIRIKGRDV